MLAKLFAVTSVFFKRAVMFCFKVSRLISILDKQTISMPNTNEANFIPLTLIITTLIINKC